MRSKHHLGEKLGCVVADTSTRPSIREEKTFFSANTEIDPNVEMARSGVDSLIRPASKKLTLVLSCKSCEISLFSIMSSKGSGHVRRSKDRLIGGYPSVFGMVEERPVIIVFACRLLARVGVSKLVLSLCVVNVAVIKRLYMFLCCCACGKGVWCGDHRWQTGTRLKLYKPVKEPPYTRSLESQELGPWVGTP
ncbi:hypothetical protein NGRA_1095 [Nosema granulosis]|uniref:Uncharacterized protein n=1 Tax=Nosema granulosis TaxID=83296 RepID=A0A9P6GZ66_9MICR|nr:hypothetical protein NGRA_1095 [Nosema granulosis]